MQFFDRACRYLANVGLTEIGSGTSGSGFPELKALHTLVRSGGIFAFQEASLANVLAQTAHLPLRLKAVSLFHDTLARSGVRTNNELFLYRDFQAAGLPPPTLRIELPLGDDPEFRHHLIDMLSTLWPRAGELGLPRDKLRLDAELDANNSFAAWCGVASAFSRRL